MTQNERLIKYLNSGKSLTSKLARSRFGVQNLRARVFELRSEGYTIATETTPRGTRYTLLNGR